MNCDKKAYEAPNIPGLICDSNIVDTSFIRFLSKYVGIQNGSDFNGIIDMSSFYIGMENYSQSTIELKYNSAPLKIHPPQIKKGERREKVELKIDNEVNNWNIIQATFQIKLPNNLSTESFYFDIFPIPTSSPVEEIDNITHIKESIYNWLTDNTSSTYSETLNKYLIAKYENNKLTIECTEEGENIYYSLDISYILPDSPTQNTQFISIMPEILRTSIRYPMGYYKTLFIFLEFIDDDNNFIEWAWDKDVRELDDGVESNELKWNKMGKIFMLSGADDQNPDDMNMIEPIWVKNEHNCKTKLSILSTI